MTWTTDEIQQLKHVKFYKSNTEFAMDYSREVCYPENIYDQVIKNTASYTSVINYKKHTEAGYEWESDIDTFDTFEDLYIHLRATE